MKACAFESIVHVDEPGGLSWAVVRLLSGAGLRTMLGAAGRAWVEERHDWRSAHPAWDDASDSALRE